MATGSGRSKSLHNFSLPCLKWGNQRFLKCVKVASEVTNPSTIDRRSSRFESKFDKFQPKQANPRNSKNSPTTPFNNSKRKCDKQENSETNNVEAVGEKLMTDLRVAAKKFKVSILEGEGGEDEAAVNARPWNLRTGKATCKAPKEEDKKCDVGSSPMKVNDAPASVEKNERTKFSISLSKEQVEEDFAAILGTRPPRRSKKRSKIVQRQLDSVFPGLWLTEVTVDAYRIPDVPE